MIPSRILITDDEEEICITLAEYLEDKGYEVFQASNGQDALRLLKEVRPHLMLLDIRMPEQDGIEILRRVRQIDNQIGVIMITAFHDVNIAQEALKLGACDFVTKPVDLNYLDKSVKVKVKAMLT